MQLRMFQNPLFGTDWYDGLKGNSVIWTMQWLLVDRGRILVTVVLKSKANLVGELHSNTYAISLAFRLSHNLIPH